MGVSISSGMFSLCVFLVRFPCIFFGNKQRHYQSDTANEIDTTHAVKKNFSLTQSQAFAPGFQPQVQFKVGSYHRFTV